MKLIGTIIPFIGFDRVLSKRSNPNDLFIHTEERVFVVAWLGFRQVIWRSKPISRADRFDKMSRNELLLVLQDIAIAFSGDPHEISLPPSRVLMLTAIQDSQRVLFYLMMKHKISMPEILSIYDYVLANRKTVDKSVEIYLSLDETLNETSN